MIFLDTTVLIDLLKGEEKATRFVEELPKTESLCTGTVNIYEIMKGVYSLKGNQKKYLDAVETMAANLKVLPLGRNAAGEAAKAYAGLKERGELVGEADCLIAGICIANKISRIATRNSKHFKRIGGLMVLEY